MSQAALKYSPVQYSEHIDTYDLPHNFRTPSGSLRRGPVAVPTGEKYKLPIRFRNEPFKVSSPKEFHFDLLPTAGSSNSEISLPEPIVVRQLSAVEQPRFVVLQKWEGIVVQVSSDSFIARLINQTDKGPDQDAEFSKEEIDQPDHSLIKPGAVFYWTLGYSDSPGGQRNRISSLRFRRLPAWNKKDIEATKLEAQKLINEINWQ